MGAENQVNLTQSKAEHHCLRHGWGHSNLDVKMKGKRKRGAMRVYIKKKYYN